MIRLEREATRPTRSKDPVPAGPATSGTSNFRIAVRFFDEHKTEHLPLFSREVADERPAPKCRVSTVEKIESCRNAAFAENRHP